MRSAYVALALRVSKNLALALISASASAERRARRALSPSMPPIRLKLGAHTMSPRRRGPNAEKGLVPYRNKTEQLETEQSRKIYGFRPNYTSSETECQFFLILQYLR
jgi:hypothetical protein